MNENAGNLPPNGSRRRRSVKTVVADNNGNLIERPDTESRIIKKSLRGSSSKSKTNSSKESKDLTENGNMVEETDIDKRRMKSTSPVDDRKVNREEDPENPESNEKSTDHPESVDKRMEVVSEEEGERSLLENVGAVVKKEMMDDDISDGVSCDPGSEEEDCNNEDFRSISPGASQGWGGGYGSDMSEEPFQEGCHFEIENGMFKCEFCGVLKDTVTELKTHLRTHTGERPFLCLVCNKSFNAKRTLLYHQFSVHGIEHKSIAARYPDIRKRKLEAGELVDESVIQDLEKKRQKFESENNLNLTRECLDSSLPFLVNGVVVENSKKRVCEICKKVCMKPSDLKRHMMSHTGERPFKCEVCGKQFRAKNSMMYHLKSAHGYMLELSPGLEERYQKLKKQNKVPTMGNGKVTNDASHHRTSPGLSSEGGSNPAVYPTTPSNLSTAALPMYHSLQMANGERPSPYCSDKSYRDSNLLPEESSGVLKHKDSTFESVNPKIFAPIPSLSVTQLVKPGGISAGYEIQQVPNSGSCDMKVDSETVLVTRLDGTLPYSGQKVCAYRCYLCGNMFNYLSKIQFHLSFHFEREIKTYHCKHCSVSLPFQYQMHKHVRKCHSNLLSNTGLSTSTAESSTPPTDCLGLMSATSLSDHYSVLRFKRKDNGSYCCMICKKSFDLESSLLKHIKMHSNHDFCYCRDCGQGFSDYDVLQKHFQQQHEEQQGSNACETLHHSISGKDLECDESNGALPSDLSKGSSCEMADIKPESNDMEERKAKEILEKEGIGEVTVVLPCDPDDEQKAQGNESTLDDWQEDEEEQVDDVNSSEIQTAPKRTLLSKMSGKSKRKASQPVRFNHLKEKKVEDEETPVEMDKSETEYQPTNNIKEEEDLEMESSNNLNESIQSNNSRTSSPAKSTASSSEMDYKFPGALPASGFWPPPMLSNAQFPHSLLATGQYLQAMASSGHVTNPVSLAQAMTNPATAQAMLASGQMSSIAQAMANAGHLPGSLASAMTTASSKSMFMPPNLASAAAAFMHPSFSFPQIYAMQAAIAFQQSKLNNNVNTPNGKTEVNETSKADSSKAASNADSEGPLDLATSSPSDDKNRNSPSTSSAGNVSDSSIRLPDDGSPNTSIPGELAEDYRDSLVGMPKVQWSPSDGGSPFGWNHMTTDGRKVTSLSRTHSRLPIVNSPVNRDQICKPTTLDDGRQVFTCPFCSKNFSSYSDINRHMDFHEDIRPYKCKYCEYYARTNSQLKVHMMRHQGIREFCCKVCNYKGVTQSDLNRHMKSQIHMLKSRNECSFCGEGFVTAKNLEKHLDGNCIVKVQQEKGEYLF